jgi:hypothetical protein
VNVSVMSVVPLTSTRSERMIRAAARPPLSRARSAIAAVTLPLAAPQTSAERSRVARVDIAGSSAAPQAAIQTVLAEARLGLAA